MLSSFFFFFFFFFFFLLPLSPTSRPPCRCFALPKTHSSIPSYLLRQLQRSPGGQRRGRDAEHAGSLRRGVAARRSGERAHERERRAARRSRREIGRRQRTRAGRHARGLSPVGFREGLDVAGRGNGRGREQESGRHRWGARGVARERERERGSTSTQEGGREKRVLMPSAGKRKKKKTFVDFTSPDQVGKANLFLSFLLRGMCFLSLGTGLARICSFLSSMQRPREKMADARREAFIIDAGRRRRRRRRRPTTLGLHHLDLRLAFPLPRPLSTHVFYSNKNIPQPHSP